MPDPEVGVGSGRICTMSKIFLDTNILVYSMDRSQPAKQKKYRKPAEKITLSRSRNRGLISDYKLTGIKGF